jgi:hypothetical protein
MLSKQKLQKWVASEERDERQLEQILEQFIDFCFMDLHYFIIKKSLSSDVYYWV